MESRYGKILFMHTEREDRPRAIERLGLDPPKRRPRITTSYVRGLAAAIEELQGLIEAGWRADDLAYELRRRSIPVAPATVRAARYIRLSSSATPGDAQRTCNTKVALALREIAELPAPRRYAKPNELRALKPELRALTKKGVRLQDIVLALREDGINTTVGRLREGLYRAPRTKAVKDGGLAFSEGKIITESASRSAHKIDESTHIPSTKPVSGSRQIPLFDQ